MDNRASIIKYIIVFMVMTACGRVDTTVSASTHASSEDRSVDSAVVEHRPNLTLALAGDVMMGTTFPETPKGAYLPPDAGRHLFDDCRDIFKSADISAINLEGVLLDGPGEPRPMTNPNTYYLFRMPTAYVANLVDAGIDFAGIANNHINDFGQPGRTSTVATLDSAGVAVAGLRGVCDYKVLERRGYKVAITQFGHGDNNLDVNDLDLLQTTVRLMREDADFVVVSFHGGAEGVKFTHVPHAPEVYVGEKRGHVDKFAHAAIDAGADLVFGHGPHVPRAWELYKDHLIIYSLGNFCAPYRMSTGGNAGLAPLAVITLAPDGKFISGHIHSFRQQRARGPVIDTTNAAARLIATLTSEDFPTTSLYFTSTGKVTPRSPQSTTSSVSRR